MSRFCFCNCPADFSADPERHAPDCPGRSGAGKARTPVPATKPALTVSAAEELDAVLHWRGKHTQAIRERDALQQRLTAADERADTATLLIQRIVANFDTEIEYHEDVEPYDLEHDQVLKEMREFLCPPKPAESSGKPCACPGCDSPRRANSPFCVAHRSAKSRTRGQDPMTAEGLE